MNKIKFLIAISVVTASCKKDPLSYTRDMAGTHKWVGTERVFRGSSTGGDTSYNITFDRPIEVIDENTIVFKTINHPYTDTLRYLSSNKSNKTITFTAQYVMQFMYIWAYDTIVYNYSKKTIFYNGYATSKGGGGTIHVHTP